MRGSGEPWGPERSDGVLTGEPDGQTATRELPGGSGGLVYAPQN
jgi:hypothetical protein